VPAERASAAGERFASELTICAGADAAFTPWLRIALFSALERLSQPARVIVLDVGELVDPLGLQAALERHPRCAGAQVSREPLEAFAEHAASVRRSVHPLLIERYGWMPWLRLALEQLLPDVERAILIDADVLVRADLAELWASVPVGRPIAAVRDFHMPTLAQAFPDGIEGYALDPSAPYFNCGVLLLDLAAWRGERVRDRVLDFIDAHGSALRYGEQDALNAVYSREIVELDPLWNVQHGTAGGPTMGYGPRHGLTSTPGELLRDARIAHFTGHKPSSPYGIRLSRGSVRLHLEYALAAARYTEASRRARLRATLGWLGGLARRVLLAAGRRCQAIAGR
jgi:Glycosyl transferase family 8